MQSNLRNLYSLLSSNLCLSPIHTVQLSDSGGSDSIVCHVGAGSGSGCRRPDTRNDLGSAALLQQAHFEELCFSWWFTSGELNFSDKQRAWQMLDCCWMGLGVVLELQQEWRPAKCQELSGRFKKPPELVGDFAEPSCRQLRLRNNLPTCG